MCGEGFSKSGSFTRHKLAHSGANPFKCDFWYKRFTQYGNLPTHNWSNSGAKVFKCNLCDKGFTVLNLEV